MMLTRNEVEEVMRLEGRARGAAFQTDRLYLTKVRGEEGVHALEGKLQTLGYPIRYSTVKAMEWLPVGLRILSLLAIKDLFDWSNDEIKAMGNAAPAYSFIVKLFMKVLGSLELALTRVPDYWRSHYSVGVVEAELFAAEQRLVLTIKGFKGHPILCKYLEGYFERSLSAVCPRRKIEAVETECVYRGHVHHRYIISWE
jgi:hypothetical protein